MKKIAKQQKQQTLSLRSETLRRLTDAELPVAHGGSLVLTRLGGRCTISCEASQQ